ncbi:MAG: cobalamin-binding protein [Pigmentiphaga sp.]|uniref:cobalamin-binding protein n=1 Tax=Pigmentiphaga sp. TaxID=1977564 RepID=UPI0029B7ABFD|nr:cobalamin-binding protein [Pigmentiphaga sp.]MDX3906306.1 cobalamin-binding protein [Pigmentiphaga sp.]
MPPHAAMTRVLRLLAPVCLLAICAVAGGAPVHDDAGREIRLETPARRVVALAPHATELIVAAGGGPALVGIDRDSNYPPSVRRLPRVGDGMRPDAERILALRPDLVVAWSYGGATAAGGVPAALLEQLGITVYYSNPRLLADIPPAIERLGAALGTAAQARAAAEPLRRRLAELAARYANRRPVRVFYQVGVEPMYTVSDRSIIGDALHLCGAVNVFGTLAAAAPRVSAEAVLHANPEAIVIGQLGAEAEAALDGWRTFGPALAAVPDHLWMADPDMLHRPGPRLIEATAALCERIDRVRQSRADERR